MVMDWFTVVILWLIAPIVEAVVIIALLTRNGRGKEEKASQAGYGMGAYKPLPSEQEGQMGGWEYGNPANLDESRLRTISIKPALAKERDKGTKKAKLAADLRDNLGTVSLITGVVLVILSGAVFATTKWQVLSDASKVFLVFGAALLFFAISCMAEKVFHIRRTGNAFYILGSVFLFLSVMAAAYFGFFGPSFALEGEGRWKVCWLGSLAMEAALLLGLRRFCDRVYTQASLWGMTVSICFMAKAFGAGINGLMGSMAWLGAGLVLAYRYMEQYTERCESFREKEGLGSLVKEALSGFLPVHFLIVCGAGGLSWLDMLGVQELLWIFAPMFFWEESLSCGLACMGLAIALVFISLYVSGLPRPGGRQWETGMAQAGIYSLIGVYALWSFLSSQAVCRFGAASLWFAALQAVAWLRRKKAGKPEKEEDLSVLWELCGFGCLLAGILLSEGNRKWIFGYLLLFSLYCLRFASVKSLQKGAGLLSACFLAAAMWEQPFIRWPQVISLEAGLAPVVMLIWLQGMIWGRSKAIRCLQAAGYVCCLAALSADALWGGRLADALILELICLAAFFRAQAAKDVWWVRISGGFILVIALFMTKEFWLCISWWAYLLTAGIGLIVFAAVSEKKKRGVP